MKPKYLIYILIIAILITVAIVWKPKIATSPRPAVTTFEECVKAGNPVMESYPRQCRTEDGQWFVETVVPEM